MEQNAAVNAQRKPRKEKRSQFSGMSKALVRRETISAYLFLLPSLFFFVGFVVFPMIICVVYSFLHMGLNSSATTFAGFANYIRMFQDPVFIKGFWNTVLIVVVAVPTVTAFSLWVSSACFSCFLRIASDQPPCRSQVFRVSSAASLPSILLHSSLNHFCRLMLKP